MACLVDREHLCHVSAAFFSAEESAACLVSRRHTTEAITLLLDVVMGTVFVLGHQDVTDSTTASRACTYSHIAQI